MDTINAKEFDLKTILSNKYTVDYFQREYKWERKNIEELIDDLRTAFFDNYKEGDIPSEAVSGYGTYFMGSVVINEKSHPFSIIDGQQRITSLTLLLMFLNQKTNRQLASELEPLIYSTMMMKKSFNIQVKEREACLKALYEQPDSICTDGFDESSIRMVERYRDIVDYFPMDAFSDHSGALECFALWVVYKLILVKITAQTEKTAYTIFETMNNRGCPLRNSDMLKGFILPKIPSDEARQEINKAWKKDMLDLADLGENVDVDNQFFQAWLRSQYAVTIRQAKVGSENQDFENIGSRYHNWFKDNCESPLLSSAIAGNMEQFMRKVYRFYLDKFLMLKRAEQKFEKPLQHVYYLQYWGVSPSLSYPLMLAPLVPDDSQAEASAKMDLVASFLDGFSVRRSINFKLFSQSSIRYTMCTLVQSIRGKSLPELRMILVEELAKTIREFDFDEGVKKFYLHGQNGRFVRYFLCRLTAWLEEGVGMGARFEHYRKNPGGKPYEIEHIWSDHFDWHRDEFEQKLDFSECRNRIGDLILLPRGTNQSYNDMRAAEKLPHYDGENLLARSLTAMAYQNNPNFTNFFKQHGLKFHAYVDYKKADIAERSALYAELAKKIWAADLSELI